jgi:H+/Cl- antiporter ClcA/CBS domain-containing protein
MTTKLLESPTPDASGSCSSLSSRLTSVLNRWQPTPELTFLISAVLIGTGAAGGILLFHFLIDICEFLSFKTFLGAFSGWGFWMVALVPTLGGATVGLLRSLFPGVFGRSAASAIEQEGGTPLSPWRPFLKMLAAAISLGTGASLGTESPSVEIGASAGALLGQSFRVSRDRYRSLLGAGAAAGFAAGFHTPIAGVFFALEVILGAAFTGSALSLLLLSAVVSDIISRWFSGGHTTFYLPEYRFTGIGEGLVYVGLGILASLLCLLFTSGIKIGGALFAGQISGLQWLGRFPTWLKPAIGGLSLGAIALGFPEVLGIGYGTLASILAGRNLAIGELSLLLSVKLLATLLSLGSGFVGGIFAPAMFLGGCLGALYAKILTVSLPAGLLIFVPNPSIVAMVGLATVLAGSVRAPLTAILLLFELTGNYQVILPVMIAVGICIWVIDGVNSPQTAGGLNLQQMGIDVEEPRALEILRGVLVAKAMEKNYLSLPVTTRLHEAARMMIEHKCHAALVIGEEETAIGILSLGDVRRSLLEFPLPTGRECDPEIQRICTRDILRTYPSEPLAFALQQMSARGIHLLPVVAGDGSARVVGVVERHHLSLAIELAETEALLRKREELES